MRQEELKDIKRGDVIELARLTNDLSKQLSESFGDENYRMEGYLLEVTGVGEHSLLGYVLLGTPKYNNLTNYDYNSFAWSKSDVNWEEHVINYHYIRTIGYKTEYYYEWLYPNDINIYTKCQSEISNMNRDLLYKLKEMI